MKKTKPWKESKTNKLPVKIARFRKNVEKIGGLSEEGLKSFKNSSKVFRDTF